MPGLPATIRAHADLVLTPGAWAPPELIRSALLGAATGLRSQMGMAMVLVTVDDEGRALLPSRLRRPSAVRSAVVAACGELIIDKSPKATSRLRPGPLTARLVLGGLAAATLAKVERRAAGPAAVVAALSAAVAAKVGHDLRAAVTRKLPDPPVALMEDAVSVALAAMAVGALGHRRADRPA